MIKANKKKNLITYVWMMIAVVILMMVMFWGQ